jgi:hypothetical protein
MIHCLHHFISWLAVTQDSVDLWKLKMKVKHILNMFIFMQ